MVYKVNLFSKCAWRFNPKKRSFFYFNIHLPHTERKVYCVILLSLFTLPPPAWWQDPCGWCNVRSPLHQAQEAGWAAWGHQTSATEERWVGEQILCAGPRLHSKRCEPILWGFVDLFLKVHLTQCLPLSRVVCMSFFMLEFQFCSFLALTSPLPKCPPPHLDTQHILFKSGTWSFRI